jgi:outer membrane receptor protein involved in Fe transport
VTAHPEAPPHSTTAPVATPAGEASTRALPAAPTESTGTTGTPVEGVVRVVGESAAERKRRSAEAVFVIETHDARRQAADLGEVLARHQGIGVQRGGGLGSRTRFSLNGLTDDQIRFFIDGVPLDYMGHPLGVANVPVGLVERVEVYRGVVPIRYGADALGGAVNLVSDDHVDGTHGAFGYQAGSFDTHRFVATARHRDPATGAFLRASTFIDSSENDYLIDVQESDPRPGNRGRLAPFRVRRFHDGYLARGVTLEGGAVGRPFADRMLVRVFVSDFDAELQNNIYGEAPYGEATRSITTRGASIRYRHRLSPRWRIDGTAGYARTDFRFRDVTTCIYDWFGRCTGTRNQPGEVTPGTPRDDRVQDHASFARIELTYRPAPFQTFRSALSPTVVTRTGDDRLRTVSVTEAERNVVEVVQGAESVTSLGDGRLENIAFAKGYFQAIRSRERRAADVLVHLAPDARLRVGGGNALRYRIDASAYAKISYEYATRLPRFTELFGDAALDRENTELRPEVSHNVNVGLTAKTGALRAGELRADVNGFLRDASNLIVRLPASGQQFRHENILRARVVGVEGGGGYSTPGELLSVDANATFVDMRNVQGEGPFARFEGDRIPNRPYLFANASVRLQLDRVFRADDRVSLTWFTRFTHSFFEFWESAGTAESKRTVPHQLVHTLALTLLVPAKAEADRIGTEPTGPELALTAEVSNLTNERVYDFFGVQRPGRAVTFKVTAGF